MDKFILSCESTIDMPYAHTQERNISVLFYSFIMDGELVEDDMDRTPGFMDDFYKKLLSGSQPATSQINLFSYEEYFTELLKQGKDILHIAFGSGMTPSVKNAREAAEHLSGDNKIVVIDSTCSSSGYGLIVDYAADMRDEGKELTAVAEWVEEHAHKVHHQFFSTDLTYFRKSGRMSGAAAAVAAVLNICPVMRLNYAGKIIAYNKVRGKKAAIAETIKVMKAHAENGTDYSGKCYICHSDSLASAEETKAEVLKNFPNLKEVKIYNIGGIIASHSGPGTVAVFFLGDERPE